MIASQNKTEFPWRSIFRLAMAQGLSPDDTWRMTPAEILTLLPDTAQHTARHTARHTEGKDAGAMTPARLQALLAHYSEAETVSAPEATQ